MSCSTGSTIVFVLTGMIVSSLVLFTLTAGPQEQTAARVQLPSNPHEWVEGGETERDDDHAAESRSMSHW